MSETIWIQKEIRLQPRSRGMHLVTDEIQNALPDLSSIAIGMVHLLLMHTSAGLALNESVEPEVRRDLHRYLNDVVPEDPGRYEHSYEGSDDMPAHIKSVITGVTLSLPVRDGSFQLGTWQGIYLGEYRNRGGSRRVLATVHGKKYES